MNKDIKEFCKLYHEKIKNDLEIKNNPKSPFEDYTDRVTFSISFGKYAPAFFKVDFGRYPNTLFALDQEDLDYLYNKYSKKLQEELDANIEALKKEYNI